jgi:hypothetical protein
MFSKRFEKLLIKEIENFTEKFNEENDDIIPMEYMEQLTKFLSFADDKPIIKKTINKKSINDEDKCEALKADGDRCNGRKAKDGSSNLCNIHKSKGTTYGTIDNPIIKSEESKKKKIVPKSKEIVSDSDTNENINKQKSKTCLYISQRGVNKGKMCGKEIKTGTFCKSHSKTKITSVTLEPKTTSKSKVIKKDSYESESDNDDKRYIEEISDKEIIDIDISKYEVDKIENNELFGDESDANNSDDN